MTANADILRRELRAAVACGDSARAERLRTTLASMGDHIAADRRRAQAGGVMVERAIADPSISRRGA